MRSTIKRFAIILFATITLAQTAQAAITAPEIAITLKTTTAVTFSIDQTSASALDSLFIVIVDDSLSGAAATSFEVSPTDTTQWTIEVAPGTLIHAIARADSGAGTQAFSNRDTTTTYQPRFMIPSGNTAALLPQAGTWNILSPVRINVDDACYDSTMWVENAPYVGVHWATATDSTALIGRVYAGRRPGDFVAPAVSLVDTFNVDAAVGSATLSLPVGADAFYIIMDDASDNGYHSDFGLYIRRHFFPTR